MKNKVNMERKIGEIFEYNGEWYQCVKDTTDEDCGECDFHCYCNCAVCGFCSSDFREDKQSVCFKKLEKVGEPYINRGKFYQNYKIFDIDNANARSDTNVFMPVDNSIKIVLIEIKQNKEDMEEKTQLPKEDNPLTRLVYNYVNGKISDKDLIESIKELPDKYPYTQNLKEFDLEAAKSGKPVCTRDGRKARIICFDRDWDMHIVALVSDPLGESVHYYLSNGKVDFDKQNDEDLMMLPETKEGWVNINKATLGNDTVVFGHIFKSREDAVKSAESNDRYIATVKIEWEE